MLRLALTPRWIVAALVLLLLVAAAVMLGRWQWERTQSILAAERAAIAQPIPVQDVFDGAEPGRGARRGHRPPRARRRASYDHGMQVLGHEPPARRAKSGRGS